MDSNQVRQIFFDFFKGKGHKIVDSAPMVLKGDPTLMFTNAGMNQFKDVFVGNADAKDSRIANSQKCLRVSGKHNDLEEVGVDTYHHTMFEMLGNWSFNDYFKEEAIEWAWDLLVNSYKLDKDRLYVTVFKGDEGDKLEQDQEAADIWSKWIDPSRILACGKKDNFWEMGASGPCGPCSEIHMDLRSDAERAKQDGAALVNNDHPQVVEIWNLVFIQFNRNADGKLNNLKTRHIDTGMGLERLCMALQAKKSNYDTDIFTGLISHMAKITGKTFGKEEKTDIAFRVVADHLRAVAFAIADGQLPSNTGAGYVIRRILRRAVRYGFSFLDAKESFIFQLMPTLANKMGEQYPELVAQAQLIERVIKEEEDNFLRTLSEGIKRFEVHAETLKGKTIVSGAFAFELYDTFGFPLDLTQLLAKEQVPVLSVDVDGFTTELEKQKTRSRAAGAMTTGDWSEISSTQSQVFTGYDEMETDASLLRYRKVTAKGKDQFQLVFDKTPFYPEGGGQVGDTGYVEREGKKISVNDTKKEDGVVLMFVSELPKTLEGTFRLVVNRAKRDATEYNHSATHLLHLALRTVLGTHVEQKGSLVNEHYLRFDFSHFAKLTDEELEKVQLLVNTAIRNNYALDEKRAIPIEEAKKMGAMALFGEKYGDKVRVIRFGDSVELCGGTHVKSTGEIGQFRITQETAVAAGIRRIEAITAAKADELIAGKLQELEDLNAMLKHPQDLSKAVAQLINRNVELEKKVQALVGDQLTTLVSELTGKGESINGITFIAARVALDGDAIKDLAFRLKHKVENLFLVLASESDGRPGVTVMLAENLVAEKDLNAVAIVKELAKEIKGGGGGQPFFATAGGKDVSGLERVLEKARKLLP